MTSRIECKVVIVDALDLQAYSELQKESFVEIFNTNRTSIEHIAPAFFSWKYTPPAGKARIATIFEEGKLVASNAMFPVRIRKKDQEFSAWQSCDTATLPAFRGRGYFQRCILALQQTLHPGELFFGFPNAHSKKGLVNAGWQENITVPLYAKYVRRASAEEFAQKKDARFGEEQNDLAARLCTINRPMIYPDADYMNWRYRNHPLHYYECFEYLNDGRLEGNIMLRNLEIRGRKMMMIMEMRVLNYGAMEYLLWVAALQARKAGCNWIAYLGNAVDGMNWLRNGYFPVPVFFQPKRQLLMGIVVGGNDTSLLREKWSINTGDWDGF